MYQTIKQQIIDSHNIVVDDIKVDIMLLYYGSIFINGCNVLISDYENKKLKKPVFYGMIFGPSSSGKDFLKNQTREFFKPVLDKILLGMNNSKTLNIVSGIPIQKEYQDKIIPNIETSITGSNIGLYMLAYLIEYAGLGSLNITVNEFADILGQNNNLNMLKELYDGNLQANVIQGDKDNNIRKNIENIPTNLIMYGSTSSLKDNSNLFGIFKKIAASGLYRRSFIFSEPIRRMVKKESTNIRPQDVSDIFLDIYFKYGVDADKGEVRPDTILRFTDDAKERLKQFSDEMFERANNNLYDDLIPLDRNVDRMIQNVAAIIHWIDCQGATDVDTRYVDQAIDIFKRSRETITELFISIPDFERIYDYIKYKGKVSESDIIKALGLSPKAFKENIEYLPEWAIKQGTRLITAGSKLKTYSIEEFQKNDLSSIIVSIPAEDARNKKFAKHFQPLRLPFYEGENSLYALLKNDEGINAFALAHYAPTAKAPLGHREEKSFILGQNAIAFDFDGGLSIEDAKKKFYNYTYILYTTKSHTDKKHRFRVILPTKTEFYVTPEEHKRMYENVCNMLGIQMNDMATRNVTRSWAINPSGSFYLNLASLFDVMWAIENSAISEEFESKFDNVNENEINKRVYGMMKYAIANQGEGRNNMLHRLAMFCLEADIEPREYIEIVNNKFNKGPLPESEINLIISSAKKRIKR